MVQLVNSSVRLFRNLKQDVRFKFNTWTALALLIGVFIFIPMAEVLWHLGNSSDNWDHLKETVWAGI